MATTEITPDILIGALESTWTGTIETCRSLTDEEWARETGCPGWTVKDNVSHLVGIEAALLGRPAPEHTVPDFPHIRGDMGRFMEVAVDIRRDRSGKEVLAEFEEVAAERLAYLRGVGDGGLEEEMPGPFGRAKARDVLPIRVFDCWCHEQDIRRAVGRPGGLDGPAARLVLPRIQKGLARAAATTAGLEPGTSVAFRIDGPIAAAFSVVVGEGGRGEVRDGAASDAVATIETDSDNFVALIGGRADARHDTVAVTGDASVAGKMVGAMGLTP